ncbi:MAG: mannitol dehydrogenase [Oscillospiraceae bacterium]|jgi:mannitol-1-phosphate 5-dehydrogenase|nr:mannitol dehydrogenase [Oscillospiraceae bacterium]
MKKAVMYGAGNIGRGFVGQLFSKSGYEVCFIDVNEPLVNELNRRGEYPVRVLLSDGFREEIVANARAVNGRDKNAVALEIARADIMATAVGVNVLPYIASPVAAGLTRRFEEGGSPLDIIICENKLDADQYLRELIGEKLKPEIREWAGRNVGLVEASIGRMVPVQTDEMRRGDNLRISVEEYAELPVDKTAFKCPLPEIEGLLPAAPFAFYIERKLYIHNMGHAAAAYFGAQKGYAYIWQAINDPQIRETVFKAMLESGIALAKKHGVEFYEVYRHITDLIGRFANRQLGDTVARVGRDLPRKLADNDRLFGAANLCGQQSVENTHILKAIGAALAFPDGEKAPGQTRLRQMANVLITS